MDLSQYSEEELAFLAQSPNAGTDLKKAARMAIADRERQAAQAIPTVANPTVDPLTGQPSYGAPGAVVNALPSLINLGNDLIMGGANVINHPIDTITGLPGGLVEHYKGRYFGEDAPGFGATFSQDPVGAIADFALVGGVANALGKGVAKAGATQAGKTISTVGRNVERLDPVNLAMGAGQLGVAGLRNKFARSPEEQLAGYYGVPKAGQRTDLPGYLESVGEAMDAGYGPTLRGALDATEARKSAGARIGELMDELDAAGVKIKRVDLVKQLMPLAEEANLSIQAPYRNAIDQVINDLLDVDMLDPEAAFITPGELQRIKQVYSDAVPWDAGSLSNADRAAVGGYADATGVLREAQRGLPGVQGAMDEFKTAAAVEDVVTRGAAAKISEAPGARGDFIAVGLDYIAPALTGQGLLKRGQGRRALRDEGIMAGLMHTTDVTPLTRTREGLLASERSTTANEEEYNKRWHVGMLWED